MSFQSDMNWTEWYRKTGNSTVYWYATGKRVGFAEIVGHAFFVNRSKILANINQKNGFLAYMRGKNDPLTH